MAYVNRFRDDDRPHWVLGPFWTAAAHRRTGVCRQLFDAVAADATAPLAWLGPFTDVGKQFADAVDPSYQIPVGY